MKSAQPYSSPPRFFQRLQNKRLGFWLKLALSLVLLAAVFRAVDWGIFFHSIVTMSLAWFALSVAAFFPAQLLAAYRWFFVLRQAGQKVAFGAVLRHNILGQLAALFLPGQVSGDIVRTIAIANGRQDKAVFILATIIDKILLLLAIALFGLLGALFSFRLNDMHLFMSICSAIFLLGCGALYFFVNAGTLLRKSWLYTHRSRMSRITTRFGLATGEQGGETLRARALAQAFGLALLLQAVNSIGGYCMVKAMALPIGAMDWFAINALVAFVQVLPISIGGLGVRESVLSSLFLLYGVAVGAATAFSLVNFFCSSLLVALSWLFSDTMFPIAKDDDHDASRSCQPSP